MKRLGLIILAAAVVIAAAVAVFLFKPASLPDVSAAQAALPTGQALIDRGEYLARAADCVACHTTSGGKPYAGGLAFKLPFGTLYAPNITPDKETGIGDWSDAEFVRALHQGIDRQGHNLYPAFPYAAYARMTTEDALAIKAYLFSLPAVHADAPRNDLTFPFNQRYVMRFWNLLFVPGGALQPNTSESAEWNRGAYLVEAMAHCGECHTPRNVFYALDSGKTFAGAELQGWKAYNVSSDKRTGIGNWTDEQLFDYLSKGHAEGRGSPTGSMGEAVDYSLRHLTPEDIKAIVAYVKTVPPQVSSDQAIVEAEPATLKASTAYAPSGDAAAQGGLGLKLFQGACASCHGWNGEGLQTPYAALRGSRTVNDPDGTNLIQVILKGAHMTTATGAQAMPAFANAYSNVEIAALGNYVLAHFGGKQSAITPADVAKARMQ
ncbi:c-type cytochrome [Mesorhizobium loti]|nr:c-type cytochrome [Mesorhizobium loti]